MSTNTNWKEYADCMAQAALGADKLLEILSAAPEKAVVGLMAGQMITSGNEGGKPIVLYQHPDTGVHGHIVGWNSRLAITQVPNTNRPDVYCVITVEGKLDGASVKVKLSGTAFGGDEDWQNDLLLHGRLEGDQWEMSWRSKFQDDTLYELLSAHGFTERPKCGKMGIGPICPSDLECFGAMVASFLAE